MNIAHFDETVSQFCCLKVVELSNPIKMEQPIMFRGNISTKSRWLLIMGLVLLMLTSFWACSQDDILNPRNTEEENDDTGDGDDTPTEDPGGGTQSNNGKSPIRTQYF